MQPAHQKGVEGGRVILFKDPECHLAAGEYAWRRDESGLCFTLVADVRELGTRAQNSTQQRWQSCQPPDHEAAGTGHWKTPAGCEP